MITKEQAMSLSYTRTIYGDYHTNADGSPIRWRVNGMCKTWKTRPDEFRLPIKHGLKDYFYLTHANAEMFFLEEKDARASIESRARPASRDDASKNDEPTADNRA
jgi:hypothetical protein